MRIPQSLVRLCAELKCPIRATVDQLKPRSTAYNFPLRRSADAQIGVKTGTEASEIIRWATRNSYEVLPQGGNTSLVEGATPTGPQKNTIILSSIATDIQINPEATRLTAGAGVSLQNAQLAAERSDRWIPMTYASKGTATLGGAVATRAMGMGPGIPQLLKKVTIVDGTGAQHSIHYDTPPQSHNSNYSQKTIKLRLCFSGETAYRTISYSSTLSSPISKPSANRYTSGVPNSCIYRP